MNVSEAADCIREGYRQGRSLDSGDTGLGRRGLPEPDARSTKAGV